MTMSRIRGLLFFKCLGIIFLYIGLSGCGASLGKPFEMEINTPSNKATIYIYRGVGGLGFATPIGIIANGSEIASIPHGGYIVYFADEEEIEFGTTFSTGRTEAITLDVQAQKVYFLKIIVSGGILLGHATIQKVPIDQAIQESKECKQVIGQDNKNQEEKDNYFPQQTFSTKPPSTIVLINPR